MAKMTEKELYQTWHDWHPKVFGYFFRRLNSRQDVEDLTSVVLTAFLDKLQDPEITLENQQGFVWRVAHNQLAKYIRDKSKVPVSVSTQDENWSFVEPSYETEYSFSFKNRLEKLLHCIKKHSKNDEYLIIEKSIIEEKKSSEVAEILNISPDNVRQKLSRSLKKIRASCKSVWQGFGDQTLI
jgi:RNA polymerase sigma factor (sigma-70 family)